MPASSPGLSAIELDLHPVRLGPAHVHPRQHLRPVAALGAARTGVDLEEGVVAVGLAVEQRLDLPLRRLLAQRRDRRLGVGHHRRVALGLAELDQLALVRELPLQPAVRVDRVREQLPVAHQLLRPRRVVPEVGRLGHRVQLFEPVRGGLPAQPLPQQRQRLLDLFHQPFGLGAHRSILVRPEPRRHTRPPAGGQFTPAAPACRRSARARRTCAAARSAARYWRAGTGHSAPACRGRRRAAPSPAAVDQSSVIRSPGRSRKYSATSALCACIRAT